MNSNLIILLFSITTAGIFYSMPIPLYPKLCMKKGYSDSFIGIVFSMYSIVNLFLIPFISNLISKFTRFNLLILSFIAMILSTFLYILLDFINEPIQFTILSLIARSFQGASIEFISILIFSITMIISSHEEAHDNLGYAEMSLAFGKIIGPLIVLFFDEFGYPVSFIIGIGLDFLALILLIFFITVSKDIINRTGDDDEKEEGFGYSYIRHITTMMKTEEMRIGLKRTNSCYGDMKRRMSINKQGQERELGMLKKQTSTYNKGNSDLQMIEIKDDHFGNKTKSNKEAIKKTKPSSYFFLSSIFNKLIILTFIVCIIDFISAVFYMPIYSIELYLRFGINERQSSLYLSLFYLIYVIGLRFIILFNHHFTPKFMMSIGLLINSFAVSLYSPLGLYPYKLEFAIFGYALQNFFGGIICLNGIIDLTESYKKLGLKESQANDYSSALYFMAINFSELIGPIIGGVVTSAFNYEMSCIIVGFSSIVVSIIFFLYNKNEIYLNLNKQEEEEKEK